MRKFFAPGICCCSTLLSAAQVDLNMQLQTLLDPGDKDFLETGKRIFKLDDKVMQIANNYDKGVFNGDMGFIRYISAKERVIAVKFDNERLINILPMNSANWFAPML